jgi:hypothetical protein
MTKGWEQTAALTEHKKKLWEELICVLSVRNLFEVLELNLIKCNLSKVTLTSFNSI